MKHRLFVPSAPRVPGGVIPLVVALHGCTQTASDFAAGTRFDSVAERAGTYVLYPEQSVLRNPNRCWNWYEAAHQTRESGEPAEILALVDDVVRRHPIDPECVFVAGMSAGGAMAAILAEQAPDVVAAVGIMAGVSLHASVDLRGARAAMAGDPAMHVLAMSSPGMRRLPPAAFARTRATIWTGGHDRTVDPSNGISLARQFLELFGLEDVAEEHESQDDAEIERWRDARGIVRVETWRVAAMGHAWSGGSFRGSHTWPRGPRASDAMMRFFLNDREDSGAGRSSASHGR